MHTSTNRRLVSNRESRAQVLVCLGRCQHILNRQEILPSSLRKQYGFLRQLHMYYMNRHENIRSLGLLSIGLMAHPKHSKKEVYPKNISTQKHLTRGMILRITETIYTILIINAQYGNALGCIFKAYPAPMKVHAPHCEL
jgi:hypothetical protein